MLSKVLHPHCLALLEAFFTFILHAGSITVMKLLTLPLNSFFFSSLVIFM